VTQKGRKKNVYFSLDFLSVYTIIDCMKGLNCYARFCGHPGIEKLYGFDHVKSSFLMRMSPSDVQARPFTRLAVFGSLVCHSDTSLRSRPNTVFFFVRGLILVCRLRLPESSPPLRGRAGDFKEIP